MMHFGNIAILLLLATASPALAVDWMFAPSTYTHDPQTAHRVSQYAEPPPVYARHSPDYRRSGFRYNTSVNRVGQNADRIHIVEEWGRTVRPYGEWQFPYRPYAVPYDAWGPPFGGLEGVGFGNAFGGGWGGFPQPWLGPYGHPPGHGQPHKPGAPAGNPHQGHPGAGHFLQESRRGSPAPWPDRAEDEPSSPESTPKHNPARGYHDHDRPQDGAYGKIEQGAI